MIKALLFFLISFGGFSSFAQINVKREVSYTSSPTLTDGISISATVNISSKIDGGLYFEKNISAINIKRLRIYNIDVPITNLPQAVINEIRSEFRASVSFDLRREGRAVKNLEENRGQGLFIGWDEAQGLKNNDATVAIAQSGKLLLSNNAFSIDNIKIESFDYFAGQAYRDFYEQVRKGGAKKTVVDDADDNTDDVKTPPKSLIPAPTTVYYPPTKENNTVKPVYNAPTNNGSKIDRVADKVSGFIGAATPILQQLADDANERRRQANAERFEKYKEERRIAQERADIAEERAAIARAAEEKRANIVKQIEARQAFIGAIADGKFPLTADRIKENEIYCFSFSVVDLDTEEPNVKLSNVFPIAKYGDGTWPFISSIKEELTKLNPQQKNVLVGYYVSQSNAKKDYDSFVAQCNAYGFKTTDFEYKGKPYKNSSATNTDFWGNENKVPAKSASNDDDFWGTPVKTTNEKKVNTKETEQFDFWGNPINVKKSIPIKKPVQKKSAKPPIKK